MKSNEVISQKLNSQEEINFVDKHTVTFNEESNNSALKIIENNISNSNEEKIEKSKDIMHKLQMNNG